MRPPPRAIFRAEAVQRYLRVQEEAILPRFESPYTSLCQWLLTGLLLTGIVLFCSVQVPIYEQGQAVVLEKASAFPQNQREGELLVVSIWDPELLPLLHIGQTVLLPLPDRAQQVRGTIIAIEPELITPGQSQRPLLQSLDAIQTGTQPAAVALAQLGPLPQASTVERNRAYPIKLQVGSQSFLAFLSATPQANGE